MIPYSIKQILVAVDLTVTSLNAVETAVSLARKHKAALVFINVVEPVLDCKFQEHLFSGDRISSDPDVLNALANNIKIREGIVTRVEQLEGNAADMISMYAFREQASLIVAGRHGASGYRDGFMGSTAYQLVKKACCPVLIIPHTFTSNAFRKVLFPIRPVNGALRNYNMVRPFLDRGAVLNVLGLTYNFNEKNTHVLERIIDDASADLHLDGIHVNCLWGSGNLFGEDVLKRSHDHGPDLVILSAMLDVTSKPNFIGPHTQKILNCSKSPVLVLKQTGVPSLA